MSYANRLKEMMAASIAAKQAFLQQTEQLEAFERAATALVESYNNGGRLYIAGNGGSAADAQHLAAEFVVRLERDRGSLAAEALTVDSSTLTAIGNDYGFEELFARQLRSKLGDNDLFLAITTSGNSANIVRALETCRERGRPSILFTGRDGGKAAKLANHVITAPGESTNQIQEIHIVLAHALCSCVERALFSF